MPGGKPAPTAMLGWFLEKTHDLLRLARELEARQSDLSESARPLALGLAGAYFATRYPGFDLDDPDWPTLRASIVQVDQLLRRVLERLGPET